MSKRKRALNKKDHRYQKQQSTIPAIEMPAEHTHRRAFNGHGSAPRSRYQAKQLRKARGHDSGDLYIETRDTQSVNESNINGSKSSVRIDMSLMTIFSYSPTLGLRGIVVLRSIEEKKRYSLPFVSGHSDREGHLSFVQNILQLRLGVILTGTQLVNTKEHSRYSVRRMLATGHTDRLYCREVEWEGIPYKIIQIPLLWSYVKYLDTRSRAALRKALDVLCLDPIIAVECSDVYVRLQAQRDAAVRLKERANAG